MASDYLLKIKGIDGESDQKGHEKWIEIESFSWGASNAGSSASGSGGGTGKVSMQDFHFVMTNGVSSPKLMLACATGEHIGDAELHLRKAGGKQEVYLSWKFTDILISSYQTGGSSHGSPIPTDQVSFNFTKVELEYKPQKNDGSLGAPIKASYDVKKGTKG